MNDTTRRIDQPTATTATSSVPPSDNGQRLATIRRGPDSELRVVLVPATGDRPGWVSVREWARAGDGAMWPRSGRYVGVGLDEIPMVVEALRAAQSSPVVASDPDGLESIREGLRGITSRHRSAARRRGVNSLPATTNCIDD